MIDFNCKTLIILPHLDDEFALTPLLNEISKKKKITNFQIIYCCERINSSHKKQKRRRKDNLKSLNIFGIKKTQITYLNDYMRFEDNFLFKSSYEIYNFLSDFFDINYFQQVLTLNFEGGHPDHDILALIVDKLSQKYHFSLFFFPAYNYRRTLIFPLSVLRPLKTQENKFTCMKFDKFCWLKVLRIGIIYSTERFPFMIMLPFLIYKVLFSKKLIFFNHLNLEYVDWNKSLSLKRYNVKINKIYEFLEKVN